MKDGNELGVIDVYEYVEIEVGSAWKQVLLVSGEEEYVKSAALDSTGLSVIRVVEKNGEHFVDVINPWNT